MIRSTHAEIDLTALRHNFMQVRKRVGQSCQVMAVVKADAYGHGVAGVAPALAAAGVDQYAVAMVSEGVELRSLGIRQPIVILGGAFAGEELQVVSHDLHPVIFELEGARRLDHAGKQAGKVVEFHLKLDTGMGRLGFTAEHLDEALSTLGSLRNLRMIGVLSHLAVADEPQQTLTETQISLFHQLAAKVEAAGNRLHFRHIANSAAIYSRDLAGCNLVRPGIALYGGLTGETATDRVDQRSVMRLVSSVAQLKEVAAGSGISYGHRFIAQRPSRIAAVPVGYADGYNRLLSNCGEMLIGGRRARVAGTVCMDWTLVDVTDLPNVKVGDQVTLLGQDGEDAITAEEWADKVGSITYELFCNISKRVPRVYVGERRVVGAKSPG
ncbi:MAG: alanine racemase [Desulfuromonas sp.]|nr:MAG: alanine racemase [Desulfuromonas sp.]